MADTYIDILPELVPTVLRGPVGERFVGGLAALLDQASENGRHALRSAWVGDNLIGGPGPAYDALTPAGKELDLVQYPPETWPQYHSRLNDAWETYQRAGDENTIVEQLALLGFPGAVIYTAQDWPSVPGPYGELPYWSQFWIVLDGDALGLSPAALWGAFNWTDGTLYGIDGLTSAQVKSLRDIVKKWKPAHWICRAVMFKFGGWLWGDGSIWGEPGLVYGGGAVGEIGF